MLEPPVHDRMREFLHVCFGVKHNLLNDREIDSPDGGREVLFTTHTNINKNAPFRFATVEMADDGNIYLLLSNRATGTPPILATLSYSADLFVPLIRRIQRFLATGHES